MFCPRVLLSFFCTCLFLYSPSAPLASDPTPLPLGTVDFSGSGAGLDVLRGAPEYTSISLSSSNVVIEDQTLGFETYQAIGIPGEPFIMEEGVPEIPMIARFYRVPNLGGVDLVLSNTEDFEVIDDVNVMPYQIEGSDHFGMARSAIMDQDQWYPSQIADMSEPMIMRDFRVVRLALYPVQVNPVTHQARIYHNLQAEIVANGKAGVNEITNPTPPSGSWVPMYRNLLPNLTDAELADATIIPGRMMIMCKPNGTARQWADSLRIWKKRKGFDVFIDSTHTSSASAMISYIQSVYAAPGPKLEFVCLIGDPDWSNGVPTDAGNYDHSFALGNNGDDLEDIGVGRLSGDATGLMTINAKIMGYERNPWIQNSQGQADTMWFHRGFFYAGLAAGIGSNYTCMQWGAQQFRNWTGVDTTRVESFNGGWNLSLVQSQLALGISFFLIRPSYVGEVSYPLGSIVTWKLPIGFVYTCDANDFVGGTGNAEEWVTEGTATNPKGLVACCGTATPGTHAPQNVTMTGGTMYNIANLGVEHYGHCINGAKLWLTLLWGPGSGPSYSFSRWNNLMGDPSLSIWTDVPNVMAVDHPTTVNVGTRNMDVNVTDADNGAPIADALVVLWKGNETWVRAVTDVNGNVQMPITVNTSGELLLTVTKRNHKPYLYSVNCVAAEQMVTVSSYTVDDDNSGGTQGNNNDLFNPGEIVDLPLYLRNFGTGITATGVSATLSSDNTNVTVVSGASAFADIAPNDSSLSVTPFRVQISPVMGQNETALLTFTVTASSVQTLSYVELTCHSGQADYVSHSFTGTVNPGTTNNLQVTLHNSGDVALTGATAQLISLSPFVQVDDGSGTFGNIPSGGNASNASDQFTVTSNTLTFRGHQAGMRLILSTTDGFVDTTQFTVSIGTATGTDPTGPDAYGYYAYDNTDVSYEMCPAYEYVNISAGLGENLSINDPGDPGTPFPVLSRVRALPFHFTFYGQEYDTVTICSNGWMAFGNQGQLDLFRNYPMPAMQAPDAMIAPYWDDLRTNGSGMGVWKYDDVANHRCIIQWKAGIFTSGPAVDFEVILLDTSAYPTFDGNGQVLVQYNAISMAACGDGDEPCGATLGIQAPRGLVALQYAFLNNGSVPGSANITAGRALLYTTNARMLFGAVEGTITDAETNLPEPGVDVTLEGYSYHVVTNAAGHYLIDDVLIGTYTVRAHKRAFNDTTHANTVVSLDDTAMVNFSMLHPELTLSADTIHVSIPEQPSTTQFDIVNGGNGPLDFAMTVVYAGDQSPDPWDSLGSIDLSQATGDYTMQGVEFAGDHWYVSGAGSNGQPTLYRFDTHGAYAGSIPQAAGGIGWFDLAWDGQYLYGSEQRSSGGLITGIDLNGQVQTTIPCPVNPARAIAYDPDSDHFWVADYSYPTIFEISRDGTIVDQVENDGNPPLNVTGLAWDETAADGFKLLLFCHNGSGTQLWKLHPVSHELEFITDLAAASGDHSGGLAITPGWNSTLLVLGGILQGPSGDRLGIYEVTFNTTWIDVSPMQAILPGNQTQEVTITFIPTYLRTDTYRVNLRIRSEVLDSTYVLPVILDVISDVPDTRHNGLPTVYALYQNYPNPFNPSTDIVFDLPSSGKVRLQVYNTLGQQVRTLVDGVRSAGTYRAAWNGQNDHGANLAAGVYIYRLETSSFVSCKKMVLLR